MGTSAAILLRPGGVRSSVIEKKKVSRPEIKDGGIPTLLAGFWKRSGARAALTTFSFELISARPSAVSGGLLAILSWISGVFIGCVLLATVWIFGAGLSANLYLAGMLAVTAALPFLHRLLPLTAFWSWFLCIFLVLSSSLVAVIDQGIASPASVFLLIPILWSLLLLRSRGSTLIALLVLLSYPAITFTGLQRAGSDFSIATNAVDYIRCFVLMLSAITFALIGWLISEGTTYARQTLIEARDAAETANREKSEFIASIAHEIRTPMTGLMGMLELLSKEPLDQNQREMAVTARASSRDILNLINDLLDMSKMEIGELRLVPEPVNIAALFDLTVREFQAVAVSKGLAFETIRPEEPVWILIDPLRFRQVLTNYLSNAVKFTETGRITACLTCLPSPGGDIQLRLDVSDTGPGIPPHLASKIFDRFVQVEQAQKARFGGTGIGLAVVADLARLQGGQVWVESVPGMGSSFFFECTFKRTSAMEAPVPADREHPALTAITVLIADDSVGSQRVLTRVLRGLGYETISVENGADAVLSVTRDNIDIILMDLNMPVKDGPTALKDIRSLPAPFCDIPVIGLSADNSVTDSARWREADVNGFVAKPVDFAVLDQTLRRFANGKRSGLTPVNTTSGESAEPETPKKAKA